jgi:hypothetical protein
VGSRRPSGPSAKNKRTSGRRTPRLERLEDRAVPAAYLVNTTADSGPGSLRDAITQVNADTNHALYGSPGNQAVDEIDFAVTATSDTGGGFHAGTGVATFTPHSFLPFITNAVTIDAWTQGGTNYNGPPLIELNGSQAGGSDGLSIQSGNDTISGLVINRFANNGVAIYGGSGNDVVEGCYIGTDVSGTARMPNGGQGILVFTSSNRIGTNGDGVNDSAEGNLISGNNFVGVQLVGAGATGNVIAGNRIGTDVAGTLALANAQGGVALLAGPSNNRIGTSGHEIDNAGERNLISGNNLNFTDGILITPGCSNNVIAGNYIGTDVTGMQRLSNGASGITANGDNTFIGTDANGVASAATGNVISGNVFIGVSVGGAGAFDNIVAGNYIGTDATGTAALGNTYGVWIAGGATDNTVGGTTAAARNIISANGNPNGPFQVGLGGFMDQGTSGNVVEGNYIGTDVTGSVALGVGEATGVSIRDTSNNTIGGVVPGAGNLIAGTGGLGGVVLVQDNGFTTFGDSILGNSIHDNAGGGIVLGSGANNNQAAPVLTAAYATSGATIALGTLAGTPNTTANYRLEFFANPATDPEGRTLLGSWSGPVTFSAGGQGSFTAVLPAAPPAGQGLVTATATDPAGDTSQFSAGLAATPLPPSSLCGDVFKDFNQDGFQDFGELGLGGVAVQLAGTDFIGRAVSLSATTAASGYYQFANLLPGSYTVSVPGSLTVTEVAVGLNGSPAAVVGSGNSSPALDIAVGTTMNVVTFGVQPAAGDALRRGQTAGIGFWNNRNGQALLKSLNGGGTAGSATQLGTWLADTFAHLFGSAGANLAGQSNAQVASYFQALFATRGDKLEAQVMATTLSVYVTNSTLAGGTYATSYGFTVAAGGGAGLATFNVGSDGAAVGQANGATMTLLDILLAADGHATHSSTAAGFVLYSGDQATRSLADDLFGRINDTGGI